MSASAAYFGGMLARAIPDSVDRYIIQRRTDGAANATINRELAALKRMFRLAVKAKRVSHRLDIDMLSENGPPTASQHDEHPENYDDVADEEPEDDA